MKMNVYQMVTDRIVEELHKGIIPWHKPWTGVGVENGGAINYVSRKPYSLLNQMLLGRAGEYLTFKQIKDLKGSVKKGAKSQVVVFYTMLVKGTLKEGTPVEESDNLDKYDVKRIPMLRYYRVFHIEDCEGIESKIKKEDDKPVLTIQPIEAAEKVVKDYVAREKSLKFYNDKPSASAYYSPSSDMVVVPMLTQYQKPEEYYSTTFHELTHSTGAKSRCDRSKDLSDFAAFGSEEYSREELVAEIGSAMLCKHVGIDTDKAFKNSVAYIQIWLKALNNDNKMIVWASSRAEKAAKYILNLEE